MRNDPKELIEKCAAEFSTHFGYFPSYTGIAPGRINIIGEHTDYNEGLSLAAGINRWAIVCASVCKGNKNVSVKSGNFDSAFTFSLDEKPETKEKWHSVIYGAVTILKEEFSISEGLNIYLWGNIPIGSGVSSSAAIEVAIMQALRKAYNLSFDDRQLLKFCQQIEHRFMHIKTGLLDQFASLFSAEDKLILLDFRTLHHELIKAETQGWIWILTNTMVKRELASSKYSERVEETRKAFEILEQIFPEIKHFRDIRLQHLSLLKDNVLHRRIEHFIRENQRVLDTVEALKSSDFTKLGNLLNESHQSLKDYYEVSCGELDFLASYAQELPCCAGARMMGGGFGGCTISLVQKSKMEDFSKAISESYEKKFNIVPEINSYEIVNGATVINHSTETISK